MLLSPLLLICHGITSPPETSAWLKLRYPSLDSWNPSGLLRMVKLRRW
jgi:hypothetical protein